jgi:hypothetical protein
MSILFALTLGAGTLAAFIAVIRHSPSNVTALHLDR